MRGRIPPEELEYDPEIERTARRNNSKKKKEQDLAKQQQQEGTSTVIPSLTTILEDTMAGIGQNPPEGNQNQNLNDQFIIIFFIIKFIVKIKCSMKNDKKEPQRCGTEIS